MALATEDQTKLLLHLFDRPTEPVFMVKDDKVWFKIPEQFLVDRYKGTSLLATIPLKQARPAFASFPEEFGLSLNISKASLAEPDDKEISSEIKFVEVKEVDKFPNLTEIKQIGRREHFSLFIPSHRKYSSSLVKIFMETETIDDLISIASYCRDRVNPFLFNYALSLTILHRPETKHLSVPSLYEVFPAKFMSSDVFLMAKEEASLPENLRVPIDIEVKYKTASETEIEHRVAYFREDLGVNLHHWHWHLVYPSNITDLVKKDRRGELFYYMHQQILARYNMERLCNKLNFVKRLLNWREQLTEAYYPKLDTLIAHKNWPARCVNSKLKDIDRQESKFDIQDLERWRNRIFSAIHRGFVFDNKGNNIPLTEEEGIDILGNILEASDLSKNKKLYGDLHNLGHMAIAFCHDPEGKNLESFGVMGDTATAMRDPIFYRWHALIDDIFQEHKKELPPYTDEQLWFPRVNVISVRITSDSKPENQLTTYWEKSIINFSKGLDFSPPGAVYAKIKHLQHENFIYEIDVESEQVPRKCTVRIFLAPQYDDRGNLISFVDQRSKFVEMDRFSYEITQNKETIKRESVKSSVTIPYEQTFRNLDINRPMNKENPYNYCGCGWPQHMLVPKGTAEGFPCVLFVMLTDFEVDHVDEVSEPAAEDVTDVDKGNKSSTELKKCVNAFSYCGLRDRLYPDKRAMGFPFDRKSSSLITKLYEFMKTNMFTVEIKIFHENRTEERKVTKEKNTRMEMESNDKANVAPAKPAEHLPSN